MFADLGIALPAGELHMVRQPNSVDLSFQNRSEVPVTDEYHVEIRLRVPHLRERLNDQQMPLLLYQARDENQLSRVGNWLGVGLKKCFINTAADHVDVGPEP